MNWLVVCRGAGYLHLYESVGDDIISLDDYGVVIDPGDASLFERKKATKLAEFLNKKESHNLWHPIIWDMAIKDFKYGKP